MLTKEAKTVLYQLYKEYLVRRDGNVSRSRAKCFSSAESIHASLFPDCSLSDVAIVKMENQKKETLLTVADFISKFIP